MDKLLAALHKTLRCVKHLYGDEDGPVFIHQPLMLSDLERGLAEIERLRSFADSLVDDRVRLVRELYTARQERDEARRWARRLYRAARQAHGAILDAKRRGFTTPPLRAAYDALDQVLGDRRAAEAYAAWKADPSRGRPFEEVEAELIAEGLLDELDESD